MKNDNNYVLEAFDYNFIISSIHTSEYAHFEILDLKFVAVV